MFTDVMMCSVLMLPVLFIMASMIIMISTFIVTIMVTMSVMSHFMIIGFAGNACSCRLIVSDPIMPPMVPMTFFYEPHG